MLAVVAAAVLACAASAPAPEVLIWSDEFNTLNFSKWKHEITMSGGGVRAVFLLCWLLLRLWRDLPRAHPAELGV